MFKITKVEPLQSRTGLGINIDGVTIGCAKIKEIELSQGTDFLTVVKASGLVLDHKLVERGDGQERRAVVSFNSDNLESANNYVLVLISNQNDEEKIDIVTSASMITDLFKLPHEDADMLDMYIEELADRDQLTRIGITDSDEQPMFFFVNKFDEEIMDLYYDGDENGLIQTYNSFLLQSPEFMAEYNNDNFIKMLMVGIVKACQDRYNNIHRDKKLKQVADMIAGIRYWNDGNLLKPSVKDIEDFMTEIKNQIVVQ